MGNPRLSSCQCGHTVGHSPNAVMARILPTLAFIAIFVAVSHCRPLSRSGDSIRKLLAALKGLKSHPLGTEPGNCPAGGMTLSATTDVQHFHMAEYANNMDCTWNITADAGMAVHIEVTEYAIENAYMCQYDYLAVDEGDGTAVHLCGEGSFSGYSIDNVMHLHFHTDYCVTHDGFTVEYKAVPVSEVPARYTMLGVSDEVLALADNANTAILSSHPLTEHYANNLNLSTTVTAPAGMMVRLAVQAFDVEYACTCDYDFVKIYNSNGDLMHTWCGGEANGQETLSMDNMTIWFSTDGSVTATGFIFELSVTDPTTVETYQLANYEASSCPGPMEVVDVTDAILIASPNFGLAQYANNMECSWSLTAAPGKYLSVRFIDLDIEQHAACVWDGLFFFDETSIDSGLPFATICGHEIPATFTSSGSGLVIEFSTDYSVTDHGFLLEVTAVDEPMSLPENPCNVANGPMHITTNLAELESSVGSDGNYLPNSACSWVVTAPDETQTVTFNFNSFHVEDAPSCWYDSLSFYNGATPDEEALIGAYCGETSPERITSSGNVMLIQFESDYCIQHSGFSGYVTFGHDEPTQPSDAYESLYMSYYSPISSGDKTGSGSSPISSGEIGSGSSPDMGSGHEFESMSASGETEETTTNPSNPNMLPVKMVKWGDEAKTKKAKEEKTEAGVKRYLAEVSRKGAAQSKKLVEFFRAVHPQYRPLFTTLAVGAATFAGSQAVNYAWGWLG